MAHFYYLKILPIKLELPDKNAFIRANYFNYSMNYDSKVTILINNLYKRKNFRNSNYILFKHSYLKINILTNIFYLN